MDGGLRQTTYPDGEVECQPNTSEISRREGQPFLRQEVFGCAKRRGSAVSKQWNQGFGERGVHG